MAKVYFSPSCKDGEMASVSFLDPVPFVPFLMSTRGKNDVFLKCPSVAEYMKNCFVVLAPYDLELEFSSGTMRVASPTPFENQGLFEFINSHKVDRTAEQPYGAKPLISMAPMYTFYSVEPVQLEVMPPILFNTASKYHVIPGRLDLNKWIRPLDWTFEVFDPRENLVIKRKDPLFVIKLNGQDDSKIELERVFCQQDLENMGMASVSSRWWIPNLPLKERYAMAASYVRAFFKKHHPKELKQVEKKFPFYNKQ